MASSKEGRPPSVLVAEEEPPRNALSDLHWFGQMLCTSNPFYVISAGLFLAGLWISCDPEKAADTWILMIGLTGYTLLLAATAFVLIRFAKVWDDARTVLLLVVLMFLATSVTFDRTIVFAARAGGWRHLVAPAWNIAGFLIAIVISEALLRGVKLSLPTCYRVPYYLLLGLFFLYPVILAPVVRPGRDNPPMMWGLFAFSSVAAVIFLTLLPAVWRGAAALKENGSPWPWPLYPWTLFGMLGLAVPARAILLCYSMHLIDVRDLYEATFGFYFLAPLGIAQATLLLEAGLTSKRNWVTWTGLGMPLAFIVLSTLGHRDEPAYQHFLAEFQAALGVGPVWFALLLSAAFYAYAAVRFVPAALEALSAILALTMIIHPAADDLQWHQFSSPHSGVLIALATVLLGLGIWRRVTWRCLLGALGLVAGVALGLPSDADHRWLIVYHLGLVATLLVSVAFDDELAQTLRFVAGFVALVVCLATLFLPTPPDVPGWAIILYPPLIAALLVGFGLARWTPSLLTMAGLVLGIWSVAVGWQAYRVLRQLVVGLDYLVLSVGVFAIALTISLGKSGMLSRWFDWWRARSEDGID